MLALIIAVVGSLVACSSPYTYVENTEDNMFFKVPKEWRLFDEDEIFADNITSLSPQQEAATRRANWLIGFDAHPRPSIRHLLGNTKFPTGFARVSPLPDEARDVFSFAALRNVIFPIDDTLSQDPQAVEILEIQDLVLKDGFRGSRIIFNIRRGENFLTGGFGYTIPLSPRGWVRGALLCTASERHRRSSQVMDGKGEDLS
jgi:hypothetical protein